MNYFYNLYLEDVHTSEQSPQGGNAGFAGHKTSVVVGGVRSTIPDCFRFDYVTKEKRPKKKTGTAEEMQRAGKIASKSSCAPCNSFRTGYETVRKTKHDDHRVADP